jgi:hypothetical protein
MRPEVQHVLKDPRHKTRDIRVVFQPAARGLCALSFQELDGQTIELSSLPLQLWALDESIMRLRRVPIITPKAYIMEMCRPVFEVRAGSEVLFALGQTIRVLAVDEGYRRAGSVGDDGIIDSIWSRTLSFQFRRAPARLVSSIAMILAAVTQVSHIYYTITSFFVHVYYNLCAHHHGMWFVSMLTL